MSVNTARSITRRRSDPIYRPGRVVIRDDFAIRPQIPESALRLHIPYSQANNQLNQSRNQQREINRNQADQISPEQSQLNVPEPLEYEVPDSSDYDLDSSTEYQLGDVPILREQPRPYGGTGDGIEMRDVVSSVAVNK